MQRTRRLRVPGFSMIGLVLVTHGRLAVEFRAALEHVVGPQKQLEAGTLELPTKLTISSASATSSMQWPESTPAMALPS